MSGGPWGIWMNWIFTLSEFILWNVHFYTRVGLGLPYLSVGLDCLPSFMCLVIGPIATRPVHPRIFWLSKSRHFSASHVSQTLKNATTDPKVYSKTLLLPKTSFPLWVDSAKSESLFKRKTCEELYRWQVRFFSQTHQCFSLNATCVGSECAQTTLCSAWRPSLCERPSSHGYARSNIRKLQFQRFF